MTNILGTLAAAFKLNATATLADCAEAIRKNQAYVTKGGYDGLSAGLRKQISDWAIKNKFVDKDGNLSFIGGGEFGHERLDRAAINTRVPAFAKAEAELDAAVEKFNKFCVDNKLNLHNQAAYKRRNAKLDVFGVELKSA